MQLVHEDGAGEETVLADTIEVARTWRSKVRGLRFRRSIPGDFALVFPFDRVWFRDVDMLFVPFPIDVVWLVDGTVRSKKRLRPWVGVGIASADTVVELPAGRADGVAHGDTIHLAAGGSNPDSVL